MVRKKLSSAVHFHDLIDLFGYFGLHMFHHLSSQYALHQQAEARSRFFRARAGVGGRAVLWQPCKRSRHDGLLLDISALAGPHQHCHDSTAARNLQRNDLGETLRLGGILLYSPALDPHLQKVTELANLGVLHLRRRECSSERTGEGRGEDARRQRTLEALMVAAWPALRPLGYGFARSSAPPWPSQRRTGAA